MKPKHKVLIIGGGFGGVKSAQILAKYAPDLVDIQLVDPKTYMEYHAASYRLVTGRSPMEVCLPYRDLFAGLHVQVDRDIIKSVDIAKQIAQGESGSQYHFDTLILALGAKPDTYGIPGVMEYAFNVQSSMNALKLKRHLHEDFEKAFSSKKVAVIPRLQFVIVGGGATGVELSGEIAHYARQIARRHGVDPTLITVDLIEAGPSILGAFPQGLREKITKRLHTLGVNIFLNRTITKEDREGVHLTDADIRTKTVIWTAGMRGADLLSRMEGLQTDKKGRALVHQHLQAVGHENVYVIGDSASTTYAGMAQTALSDAVYVAQTIIATTKRETIKDYKQPAPSYAVPVGPNWAGVIYHGMTFTGYIGWILRRSADLRAFLALLPLRKALRAFIAGHMCVESCPVCKKENTVAD
jgi:NADH dehydrogenase